MHVQALPPPVETADCGRGRGRGAGRGRGGRRGRPCKTPVIEDVEPPSEAQSGLDSSTMLGAQPKRKVAKKTTPPNNGDGGPDECSG